MISIHHKLNFNKLKAHSYTVTVFPDMFGEVCVLLVFANAGQVHTRTVVVATRPRRVQDGVGPVHRLHGRFEHHGT